ncbi:MAG: hypothetical protein Q9167_004085 [Letrouitia subvulpina]
MTISSSSRITFLTASKGKLVDFFNNPEIWSQVSESDKDYIRSLLPPFVELSDDGSIPESFWKYNTEFRSQCRYLQEDLRAGRMDPEWQRQAYQAMKERAEGKFDSWKEKEFEEFWGQKQKVARNALAGHASKVQLEELLNSGLFQIIKIEGKAVTVAIPPGQLKYARGLDQGKLDGQQAATGANTAGLPEAGNLEASSKSTSSKSRINPPATHEIVQNAKTLIKAHSQNLKDREALSDDSRPLHSAEDSSLTTPTRSPTTSTSTTSAHSTVTFTLTGMHALEKKILAIDGRHTNGRTPNTWRAVRCYRNEQDLGSIFEMRDQYYTFKNSD